MGLTIRKGVDYVGCEYKDASVHRSLEPLYVDGYRAFGWALDGMQYTPNPTYVSLRLKRDRKIPRKRELNQLQNQYESLMKEIEGLEQSKTMVATIIACTIGVVGTAFMAGAVFSYLAGRVALMVLLAIPAFAGWALPYPFFKRLAQKKTEEVSPIIEQKLDMAYDICEQAYDLLP